MLRISITIFTSFLLSYGHIAQAAQSFGSIAYSGSSHQTAAAQSWNSTEEAQRSALYQCNANTPNKDCFIAVSFQDSCAALAVDYNGNWGAWWMPPSQPGGHGVDAALSYAKRRALQACREYAGPSATCRVIAEKCAVAFNL